MDATTCWCGGRVVGGKVCLDSAHHDPADRAPSQPASVLYVSGPMSGLPECNYPEFFRVGELLEEAGYRVVNPAKNDTGSSYREILRGDLLLLVQNCDGMALLDGWENSKGATLEHHIAEVLQMDIRPYREWVK